MIKVYIQYTTAGTMIRGGLHVKGDLSIISQICMNTFLISKTFVNIAKKYPHKDVYDCVISEPPSENVVVYLG